MSYKSLINKTKTYVKKINVLLKIEKKNNAEIHQKSSILFRKRFKNFKLEEPKYYWFLSVDRF